ncbi:MAG: DAK2 domain-containing protein [Actinomycetota bacterium]
MGANVSARTLREAMSRYLEALRTHRQEIDSLNVFPVPDGDTGTNMLMTQEAVDAALEGLGGADLGEVGQAISRAALMGARGNSGVILSQVLRGLCGRLSQVPEPAPADLAEALAEASREARRAVAEPVEGTMLSVIRDAARAAGEASEGDAAEVAEAALEEGLRSVERTREQLPELSRAGVVDAGGKGLVLLLDALVSALRDVPLRVEVGPPGPVGERRERGPGGQEASRYGYEVMFLLEGDDQAVPGLRERLGAIGDSLVIVGGSCLYNVHVHTDDPGAAVERGVDAGRPREIRITSLDEQVEACLADQARAVRAEGSEPGGPAAAAQRQATALVATAPGEGAARLLRSLGAVVVPGGPGRNPSVSDLVEAIRAAPSDDVVVLPNHKNIVPAAERAGAEVDGKRVTVVPTRSVPAGIAAAAAFNPAASLEENEGHVREGAEVVAAGEVATAVREAHTPAGPVRAGDLLGVVDGEVRAVGGDPVEVAVGVLRTLVRDEHEVLTLLLGEDVGDEEGERAAGALREAFPDLEVDVHRGDQPHYPFLVGLE